MTLHRWDVLNALLARTAQRRYLEIGVQRGICGRHVVASEKWGVDPDYGPSANRVFTHIFRQLREGDLYAVVDVDGVDIRIGA